MTRAEASAAPRACRLASTAQSSLVEFSQVRHYTLPYSVRIDVQFSSVQSLVQPSLVQVTLQAPTPLLPSRTALIISIFGTCIRYIRLRVYQLHIVYRLIISVFSTYIRLRVYQLHIVSRLIISVFIFSTYIGMRVYQLQMVARQIGRQIGRQIVARQIGRQIGRQISRQRLHCGIQINRQVDRQIMIT